MSNDKGSNQKDNGRGIPYMLQHFLSDKTKCSPRSGPSPLPVHLGLAMAAKGLDASAAPENNLLLQDMIKGIQLYQTHPYIRQMRPFKELWRRGEVSLGYCAAYSEVDDMPQKKPAAHASIILVPSLINKSYILDLLPQRSLARWLSSQGVDVYFLDWGNPLDDGDLKSVDDLVAERLTPVIEFVLEQSDLPVFALGYCMGGTLLLGAVQENSERLSGIILLASPWDFHVGEQPLTRNVCNGLSIASEMMNNNNYLPAEWIQSVFAAVNADRAADKFSGFQDMDQDSERAELFVAVEDWLNDPVHLPKRLAEQCLCDWYRDNKPMLGQWVVNGEVVRVSKVKTKSLIVCSPKDRLVPDRSSRILLDKLCDAQMLVPDTGHIGMIAGNSSLDQVWKPMLEWMIKAAQSA